MAAIIMQATLIGWIPAVMWAWKIVHRPPEDTIPTPEPKTKNAK